MTDSLNIKGLPSAEVIQEVATELGVNPSFVEKDWYAVQVIKCIAKYKFEGVEAVFSGGTSLSKGYGLIKRFSEDIDFKLKTDKLSTSRRAYKAFREEVLKQICSFEELLIEGEVIKTNQSKNFSCNISYPMNFSLDKSLRPGLKLEMGFNEIYLPPEKRSISSFVAQYTSKDPETSIVCIDPVETAADKLSALLWRIVKNKTNKKSDPSMIRHLYDLCALKDFVLSDSRFPNIFLEIFKTDCRRCKKNNLYEVIEITLTELNKGKQYSSDYEQFVDSMFYGPDKEQIRFKKAMDGFTEIMDFIKAQNFTLIL